MRKSLYISFVSMLVISFNTSAQVYRCEGADGRAAFQSRPCAGAASEKVEIHVPLGVDIDNQQIHDDASQYFEERRAERLEREARAIERSNQLREEREKQERFRLLMMRNQIAPGMTKDQVRRSWGAPCRTNRTIREYGSSDQWVYCRNNARNDYVYFRDGEVTSISQ